MKTSPEVSELFKAFSAFQKEVENPKATAENPFFHSKYATLQDTLNIVRPLLSKHGLAVLQGAGGEDGRVFVTTRITHSSGQWLEFDPLSIPFEGNPQAAGSAITYLRRYSLWAALGIAGEEDDDGNVAEAQTPKAKPKGNGEKATKTPGGASAKSYGFTKKLFVDRGICRPNPTNKPEEEQEAVRSDNLVAVYSWLQEHDFDVGKSDNPLKDELDQTQMSEVIDLLKSEIAELKEAS